MYKRQDFYSTSLVRDLVFHVQEHRMTLPQIGDMMNRLGLAMKLMIISSSDTTNKYAAMFPEDSGYKSLENWHKFEQIYPDTFANMYQFWCTKPT